ncbi:MAG: 4Fe-4S dicluster domain-containing protein [Mycobacterium leprae]
MRVSRRTFLRGAVTIGSGLALEQLTGLGRWRAAQAANALASGEPPTAEHDLAEAAAHTPSVLYDITKCVGCGVCQVACQVNKGLPEDIALIQYKKSDPATGPNGMWALRRQSCMHCVKPGCASVCPVAAMYKTKEGPVIYRDERCLGCRYCMSACPFNIPQYDWDRGLLDKALIRKCDFCFQRQAEGKRPACVDACPAKAVTFGKRSEMLAEAKKRIADNPDKYVNHIYGEHEAGGTSWLLLSGVPFDQLGLPKPPDKPMPEYSETVMKGTIPFALSWAAVLTGITGLVRLRERNADDQTAAKAPERGKEDGQ